MINLKNLLHVQIIAKNWIIFFGDFMIVRARFPQRNFSEEIVWKEKKTFHS